MKTSTGLVWQFLNITVNSGVSSELAEGSLLENRLQIVIHNEFASTFL